MLAGNNKIFYIVNMRRCPKHLYLIVLIMLSGCTPKPLVRVDLDTYVRDWSRYKAAGILIYADIGGLLQEATLLKGKEVEVSGLVNYYGTKNFWTWYVMIEKGGQQIRGYAHQYRVEPGRDALQLVRWAQAEKGEIKISGTFKDDGIAIKYMHYKGDNVTPYYKPTDNYFLPGWIWTR
jgi:hypothetical protein